MWSGAKWPDRQRLREGEKRVEGGREGMGLGRVLESSLVRAELERGNINCKLSIKSFI